MRELSSSPPRPLIFARFTGGVKPNVVGWVAALGLGVVAVAAGTWSVLVRPATEVGERSAVVVVAPITANGDSASERAGAADPATQHDQPTANDGGEPVHEMQAPPGAGQEPYVPAPQAPVQQLPQYVGDDDDRDDDDDDDLDDD